MTESFIAAPEVKRPVFNTDWTDEERNQLTEMERSLLPSTILEGDTRLEQLAYLQRFARYVENQDLEVQRAVAFSKQLGVACRAT